MGGGFLKATLSVQEAALRTQVALNPEKKRIYACKRAGVAMPELDDLAYLCSSNVTWIWRPITPHEVEGMKKKGVDIVPHRRRRMVKEKLDE